MEIKEYIASFMHDSGVKGLIKKRIYTTMAQGFQIVDEKLNALRIDSTAKINNCDERISACQADIKRLTAEVKQLKAAMQEILKPEREGSFDNSVYEELDYLDFENHFRGPFDVIKERQSMYVEYFAGCQSVLDIGCGRGEMLSVLKDNNIPAKGVDLYEEYAQLCQKQGLNVIAGDGIRYLQETEEQFDGIFLGQVVEHLSVGQLIELCNAVYKKLDKGGIVIMETPNPRCLAIYANWFYVDPSHVRPVHPLTLQYFLEKAGFDNIELINTESSRASSKVPPIRIASDGEIENNLDEFNYKMQELSELLFGSQDYAIIARKA